MFHRNECAVANGDGGNRADVLGQDVCLFDADRQAKLSAGLGKTADEFLEGSHGVCCQGGIISE